MRLVVHGYRNEARWKYLVAVAKLSRSGKPARTSDLSRELNVSPASVTEMMGRLSETGLIVYRPYGGCVLTKRGSEEVERFTLRKAVLADFFRLLGLSVEDAERQAQEMQWDISEESLARLGDLVGRLQGGIRKGSGPEALQGGERGGLTG